MVQTTSPRTLPAWEAASVSNTCKSLLFPGTILLDLSNASFHPLTTSHETISPALTALPQYLRETGYKNPSDMSYCPWHVGHRTAQSPFDWLQSHPEHMEVFLPWMTVQREGLPIFLDVIDFQKEFAQEITDDSTAVFVDVGGAMGHQCVALKQRHPELRGRIVLQDQAHIIEQVKANPMPGFDGIGVESYDFFTPQTIRGTYNPPLHTNKLNPPY